MDQKLLRSMDLFADFTDEELFEGATLLRVQQKSYEKGERILQAGDVTHEMGYVISGSVHIESNDFWGNRLILDNIVAGEFFAETFAFLPEEVLLVDVTANQACEVLFLNLTLLDDAAIQEKSWARKLMLKLMTIMARKNLILSRRNFHTAPKTIRHRVMAYLNYVAIHSESTSFEIPFDRQQMADYLNVERTALSKELGRMKREGLINFHRSSFTLFEFDAGTVS